MSCFLHEPSIVPTRTTYEIDEFLENLDANNDVELILPIRFKNDKYYLSDSCIEIYDSVLNLLSPDKMNLKFHNNIDFIVVQNSCFVNGEDLNRNPYPDIVKSFVSKIPSCKIQSYSWYILKPEVSLEIYYLKQDNLLIPIYAHYNSVKYISNLIF